MGQQQSIPVDLSKEVRVIGAGFSRTGTTSFAMALERLLDGPVCHSGTAILFREEAFVRTWLKIQDPNIKPDVLKRILREVTMGYVATTDNPSISFIKELSEIYPNALVICSTRDNDSWYESAQALFEKTSLWWLDIAFFPMPTLRYFGQWRSSISLRLEKLYNMSAKDMNCPELITIHENYVRRAAPNERLFFYNVKDGWEPLCKILNCPVPDEPFPRANDAEAMQKSFEDIMKAAATRWLQIFAVIGVATGIAWYDWNKR